MGILLFTGYLFSCEKDIRIAKLSIRFSPIFYEGFHCGVQYVSYTSDSWQIVAFTIQVLTKLSISHIACPRQQGEDH